MTIEEAARLEQKNPDLSQVSGFDVATYVGDRALAQGQPLAASFVLHRGALGVERYGAVLSPHNGRDATVDLAQELADAACYAEQLRMETGEGPGPDPLLYLLECLLRDRGFEPSG